MPRPTVVSLLKASVSVCSFTCLLALLLFAPLAQATIVPLIGDAHVSASRPGSNFGTVSNLYVGGGNTALLQFDLSKLPSGITSDQIAKATLTLFVNRSFGVTILQQHRT